MKNELLTKWICLILLAVGLVACNDDNDSNDNTYPSELNNTYSNKLTAGTDAGSLAITYSNGELQGKEVLLKLTAANTATLKLYNILPAEYESEIESISLVQATDGYTFSGNTTSSRGTTFSYSGTVKKGEMKLDLANITIPSNPLTNRGTFNTIMVSFQNDGSNIYKNSTPFLLDWNVKDDNGTERSLFLFLDDKGEPSMDLTSLPLGLLSSLLYLVLPDITFHPDGNITANYAPLAEDVNILNLILSNSSVDESMRAPSNSSPLNLCQYFVDGSTVYIRPDLEMIIRLIITNQSTKAEEDNSMLNQIVDLIMDLYPVVNRWVTAGIKFNLIENNPNQLQDYLYEMPAYYAGDYQLYLDEEEFSPVISLLPIIMDMIKLDVSSIPVVGPILEMYLEQIIADTQKTSSLKLGLYLSLED